MVELLFQNDELLMAIAMGALVGLYVLVIVIWRPFSAFSDNAMEITLGMIDGSGVALSLLVIRSPTSRVISPMMYANLVLMSLFLLHGILNIAITAAKVARSNNDDNDGDASLWAEGADAAAAFQVGRPIKHRAFGPGYAIAIDASHGELPFCASFVRGFKRWLSATDIADDIKVKG